VWAKAFVKQHGMEGAEWIAYGMSVVGFAPKHPVTWSAFLRDHPLWRKNRGGRGHDYATPRKVGAEAKALAKEWASRPPVVSTDHVKAQLTGTDSFSDWLEGNIMHGMGWKIRDDNSAIAVIPFCVTKAQSFKPMEGFAWISTDQNALREEWHKKETA
jgi:hypothetical protein